MASSYPSAHSEQHLGSTLDDDSTTPSPLQSHTSPHEAAEPPSPNGISAAVILATLSDTRPPTSHDEDAEDFEDDDETGGISLTDDGQGAVVPHAPVVSAPAIPSDIAEVVQFSGQTYSVFPYSSTDEGLDPHAAALASLTMEQFTTPPSATSPSLDEHFAAAMPNSMHAQDTAPSAYEEHLSIQDVSAFLDITSFFHCHFHYTLPKVTFPGLDVGKQPEVIAREDLRGDGCDFQGIDWSDRRATRAAIRAKRMAFESARIPSKLRRVQQWHERSQNTENYFSFRRMNTTHRAYYPHFQLRNVLAVTSRNDIYYATKEGILRTDASGSSPIPVIDIQKRSVNGTVCQITTLAASDDVLIAGGFEGEYAIAHLSSSYGTPYTFSAIRDWSPDSKSYITNHVHVFNSRTTYTPQAVLCSNDSRLRVLDCASNTFTHSFLYPSAVNCSATSPNGRMRVVVGDFHETLVTNAETGQPFETLNAHVDDVFACAWADDGVHVATAAQDSTIVVWDARSWKKPLAVLFSELSIPRALRFSPLGSGPRVLIAAEADDYINIINAQTFESKQVFDFFGPNAGISMTPDGQSLFIANAERRFGGIIELERTGWGEGRGPRTTQQSWDLEEETMDWASEDKMDSDHRVPCGFNDRGRRGIDLGDLAV